VRSRRDGDPAVLCPSFRSSSRQLLSNLSFLQHPSCWPQILVLLISLFADVVNCKVDTGAGRFFGATLVGPGRLRFAILRRPFSFLELLVPRAKSKALSTVPFITFANFETVLLLPNYVSSSQFFAARTFETGLQFETSICKWLHVPLPLSPHPARSLLSLTTPLFSATSPLYLPYFF